MSSDFAASVRRGLTATPKFLEPRFFYDDLGSALFDAICCLPEYYVTRAETEVLTGNAAGIAEAFAGVTRLVELGSGTARKTRILLDALGGAVEYVPIDVDAGTLERVARDLRTEYPSIVVNGIASDFREPSRVIARAEGRTIVLFLGSSIGNLDGYEAAAMLRDLRGALGPDDALFLGADLVKPKDVLEPAYDDALGVTAAFNLNLLQRINRELGGAFDLRRFRHLAFFNEERSRIEMHLVSGGDQRVRIEALDLEVSLAAGETIHTENSYKYDDASLDALARAAGFRVERRWTDSRGWFADLLLVP